MEIEIENGTGTRTAGVVSVPCVICVGDVGGGRKKERKEGKKRSLIDR